MLLSHLVAVPFGATVTLALWSAARSSSASMGIPYRWRVVGGREIYVKKTSIYIEPDVDVALARVRLLREPPRRS